MRTVGWYPDGTSLVSFGRDMQDRLAVFKIDATTGNTTFLYNLFTVNGLSFGYNQRAPSVAPDGRTFYQSARNWSASDFDAMIFALNSETTEFREVFRLRKTQLNLPVISPNGHHVAATFFAEGSPARLGLLEVNVQTGTMQELCTTPLGAKSSVVGWTPDSRNVVMVIVAENPKMNEVWCVPLDGSPPQKSTVAGINVFDGNATLTTQSSGNRLVWTSGDNNLRTEIWALENGLPRK